MNLRVCAGSSLVAAALDDDESDEPVVALDESIESDVASMAGTGCLICTPSVDSGDEGEGTVWKLVPTGWVELVANSSEGEMRGCMALYLLGWIVGARRVG